VHKGHIILILYAILEVGMFGMNIDMFLFITDCWEKLLEHTLCIMQLFNDTIYL